MPQPRQSWRGSSTSSVLLHVLLIVALAYRFAQTGDVIEMPQGAGGPGPAGGGGGGNRGTGAQRERVQFIQMAPPMPKPATAKTTPPPPPVLPQLQPTPLPQLELPKLSSPTLPLGSLGGSGTDGTAGSGPGSGGGVGTGVGPGRGSGIGPGTGGGAGEDFPPTPTEMFIPPLPVPPSVRGKHIVVEFDVDERGRVLSFKHTPSGDGGYDRRLDEVLRSYRFRPGHKADGTPIRMKGQISLDLP